MAACLKGDVGRTGRRAGDAGGAWRVQLGSHMADAMGGGRGPWVLFSDPASEVHCEALVLLPAPALSPSLPSLLPI